MYHVLSTNGVPFDSEDGVTPIAIQKAAPVAVEEPAPVETPADTSNSQQGE